MPDAANPLAPTEPVIYEADYSLRRKLGGWETLEALLTPPVIAEAEKAVVALQPDLLGQTSDDLARLRREAENPTLASLDLIVEIAFAIKSRAGLCDYPLASALAKSLHVFCEMLPRDKAPDAKQIETIHCLVRALNTVFRLHVTGSGGKTGQAIAAELRYLAAKF